MTLVRAVPLALTVAAACATLRGGGGQAACNPEPRALPAEATVGPMAGRFVITMVATGGAQRGQSVAGYLTLRIAPAGTPPPSASARTALVGVTDVRLETVGALRLGDTGAEDPRAPGIAVYEQLAANGTPTVTARVGSATTAAPTPGLVAIEGPYTALFVRRIAADGFAGGWSSGDGTPESETRGHFCAVRAAG